MYVHMKAQLSTFSYIVKSWIKAHEVLFETTFLHKLSYITWRHMYIHHCKILHKLKTFKISVHA